MRRILLIFVCIMSMSCDPDQTIVYYENSDQVKSVSCTKDGVLQGESKEYYVSGVLKKHSFYDKGLLSGLVTQYDEQGRKELTLNYVGGTLAGYVEQYFKNGNVFVRTFYKNGIRSNEKVVFSLNGQVIYKELLDTAGNAIYSISWDDAGKEKYSMATPVVKIDRDTLVSLNESAFIRVSFGYKLTGALDLRLEGMDALKAPAIDYQYDSVNANYTLKMKFFEPGLHKMMLDVIHEPAPGDTISANGAAHEIHIFVKPPGEV